MTGKEDGVWRTIGGRRVFIKTGQSLSDAMRESGKFPKHNKILTGSKEIVYNKNAEEIRAALEDKSNKLFEEMTPAQKEAFLEYTDADSLDINMYASGKAINVDPEIKAYKDSIDQVMNKSTIDENIVVYRGDRLENFKGYSVGDDIQIKHFVSTSTHQDVALDFSKQHGEAGIDLEIRVPKGTSGLYIGRNSAMFKHERIDEAELLLNRNISYKVLEREENKIVLEVNHEKRK